MFLESDPKLWHDSVHVLHEHKTVFCVHRLAADCVDGCKFTLPFPGRGSAMDFVLHAIDGVLVVMATLGTR